MKVVFIIIGTLSLVVAAMKIHCSEQCKQILERLGGYQMEARGKVPMKVRLKKNYCNTLVNHLLVHYKMKINLV